MQIGLLGFGTVGSHFYRLAQEHPSLSIRMLLSRRPREGLSCRIVDTIEPILDDPEISTVVELIGGIHPSREYLCAALRAGKHVVTANKAVVCACYGELIRLARANGVSLRCTAAVGGGIPWLTSLSRVAQMDRINAIEGIFNGTTNYILSEMTARYAEYGELLREAQTLGFAEADPTDDVEGYDTRRKLILSASLAFDALPNEQDIPCVGISNITAADVLWARERGLVWKLNAHAERIGNQIAAFVCPTLFPNDTPEAHTNGSFNLVSLSSARIGKQSFFGAGAGGWPTASNVLADCLAIENGAPSFYSDRIAKPTAVNNQSFEAAWLFRSYRQYTVRKASAAEAFEAYAALRTVERNALLAYLPYGML